MEKKSFKQKIDNFFGISEKGSTLGKEIVAGIVTFLAMAYILNVNPNAITLFDTANPIWPSVFIATALGAIIGTLLMAFIAKMPLAQAPGMGLNYVVGGLIVGGAAGAFTYSNAMLMVLISGILFLALSIITVKGISIRELIFDGIPESIRKAISVGIGLFIAFIGMQNCGLIVDGSTLVDLAPLNSWEAAKAPIVCLFGVVVICVLEKVHVKGAVIIGVIAATLLGIPFGVTTWNSSFSWNIGSYFANFFSMDPSNGGSFLACFTQGFDFTQAKANGSSFMTVVMTIISFCMIDMFDTMGTVVGCCEPVGLVDENDKPLNYQGIMMSDSIATVAGAMLGTSTVTTYVESGSGISAGGRTGFTALVTAICFALSLFIMPIIASIPSAAASAALIYVGSLMLKGATNLRFTSMRNTVATFFTIVMMPLAYSITDGIGFGILSYAIITILTYLVDLVRYALKLKEDKPKFDLSVVCIIVCILFIVYFFVPTTFA